MNEIHYNKPNRNHRNIFSGRGKVKDFSLYVLFIIFIFFTSCATQETCTVTHCNYNNKTDRTDYVLLPYGSVSIPGKWQKSDFDPKSKQQFFINSDSISIAVAFVPYDQYEFNKNKSKKGIDFALAYYEWDSEYFSKTFGLKRELIEEDTTANYVLYRIFGDSEGTNFDVYYLVGEKNGFANTYSIMTTGKWTSEYKKEFLKELYLTKTLDRNSNKNNK